MKNALVISAAMFLLTAISCSSEQSDSSQKQNNFQKINNQNAASQENSAATKVIEEQAGESAVDEPINIPPPSLNTGFAAPATGDAPTLNPPHGQPGHICEIPVGSPLPKATTNAPKVNTTNNNNVNTSAPAVVEETVALNPPHGQPGHICEIPVGSPLPKGSVIPKVTNTNNSATTAPVVAAPKLNPPHGQPGHRCEIPVGSPL